MDTRLMDAFYWIGSMANDWELTLSAMVLLDVNWREDTGLDPHTCDMYWFWTESWLWGKTTSVVQFLPPLYVYIYMFFPNSFSYGLWGLCQYRLRGGSGAASGGQVPGGSGNHGFGKVRRFRGRFRTTGFGAGFGGQGSAGTVPERFWPGF